MKTAESEAKIKLPILLFLQRSVFKKFSKMCIRDRAAVTAGLGSDVPLLMAITIISALFVFGGNFIANVLYGIVDPRIRKGAKER